MGHKAACAQMDSAMKSERIKEVFAGFPAMGRLGNGHAPMGFKLVGKRGKNRRAVPDPEQRRIMGEICGCGTSTSGRSRRSATTATNGWPKLRDESERRDGNASGVLSDAAGRTTWNLPCTRKPRHNHCLRVHEVVARQPASGVVDWVFRFWVRTPHFPWE